MTSGPLLDKLHLPKGRAELTMFKRTDILSYRVSCIKLTHIRHFELISIRLAIFDNTYVLEHVVIPKITAVSTTTDDSQN